jgi:hypothetical protein
VTPSAARATLATLADGYEDLGYQFGDLPVRFMGSEAPFVARPTGTNTYTLFLPASWSTDLTTAAKVLFLYVEPGHDMSEFIPAGYPTARQLSAGITRLIESYDRQAAKPPPAPPKPPTIVVKDPTVITITPPKPPPPAIPASQYRPPRPTSSQPPWATITVVGAGALGLLVLVLAIRKRRSR